MLYRHFGPYVVISKKDFNDTWTLKRSELPTSSEVASAAFSMDGSTVACMSKDGHVQIYDFETSTTRGGVFQPELRSKELDEVTQATLAYSPDGNMVAIYHSGGIEVWEAKGGARTYCDASFQCMWRMMAFQPDNTLIACRSSGSAIELLRLDPSNQKSVILTIAAGYEIQRLVLSPNGLYVGCVSASRRVMVWNVNAPDSESVRFDVPGEHKVRALGISSDGNNVAVAYEADWGRMALWSRREDRIVWDEEGNVSEIFMPLSPDCTHFVTSGYPNEVWDMATGVRRDHESSKKWIRAISADGQFVLASRERTTIYSVKADADEPNWKPSEEEEANKPCSLLGYEEIKHMSFSPNGSLIAAGIIRETGNVFVWDYLDTAHPSELILEHTVWVQYARISPTGLRLASRDYDNVYVWERSSIGADFKLLEKQSFDSWGAAMKFFFNHSLWAATTSPNPETSAQTNLTDVRSASSEDINEKPRFAYDEDSRWVMLVDGKKLWRVPESFEDFSPNIAQMQDRLVLYKSDIAVFFRYVDRADSQLH